MTELPKHQLSPRCQKSIETSKDQKSIETSEGLQDKAWTRLMQAQRLLKMNSTAFVIPILTAIIGIH